MNYPDMYDVMKIAIELKFATTFIWALLDISFELSC